MPYYIFTSPTYRQICYIKIILLAMVLLTSITKANGWKVFKLTRITRQRDSPASEDSTIHNALMPTLKYLCGSWVTHKYDSTILLRLETDCVVVIVVGLSVGKQQSTMLHADFSTSTAVLYFSDRLIPVVC